MNGIRRAAKRIVLRILTYFPILVCYSECIDSSIHYTIDAIKIRKETSGKIKKHTMKPVRSITTVNGKEWLEVFCDGKWGYISA